MNQFAPFDPAAMAGKVALITGAGGGVGRALARRFAGLGMRLALADIRTDNVEATAAEIGGDVLTWSGDLTMEPQVKELFRELMECYGRIDVAVNAAGVLRSTPFEEITKAEWDSIVDANAGSTFLVCRECCAPMRGQGWGRIVNFASLAGQTGGIMAGAHYSAGKAAVISVTRSVAKLLAPHGVRCNAVAPSGIDTEMLYVFNEEQRDALLKGLPVGRFGVAEEIAELVLFLCSPATDFITGQTININGGVYLG
jgi:3-oxoacyl-[acyl-carrier protein] reductase